MWNSLPAAVRHADNLHSFKHRLKLHFLVCVLVIENAPFGSVFAHEGLLTILLKSIGNTNTNTVLVLLK